MSITYTTNYYKQATDQGDGYKVGYATSDKLGFYGLTTPIVCPTMSYDSSATSGVQTNTTAVYGFTASSVTLGVVNLVNEIRAKLVALGLIQ